LVLRQQALHGFGFEWVQWRYRSAKSFSFGKNPSSLYDTPFPQSRFALLEGIHNLLGALVSVIRGHNKQCVDHAWDIETQSQHEV